jgi:predicted RNA-binding Zn-ribbon protein involved in translation (DUF1610 family)
MRRVTQTTEHACVCLAPGMFVNSITAELKFPAPVCDTCHVAMVTVTHHGAEKAVSYQCRKCGYGFGDQSWRAGRESVVLTFPNLV